MEASLVGTTVYVGSILYRLLVHSYPLYLVEHYYEKKNCIDTKFAYIIEHILRIEAIIKICSVRCC